MENIRKSNAGRHKNSCECPKCLAKKSLVEKEETLEFVEQNPEPPKAPEVKFIRQDIAESQTFDNKVPDLFADYEIVNEPQQIQPVEQIKEAPQAQYINGHLLLILVDTILPLGISWGANKFMNKKVTARQLKMTDDEKESLIELADATASQMNVSMPPLQLFIVSCSLIYASKLM